MRGGHGHRPEVRDKAGGQASCFEVRRRKLIVLAGGAAVTWRLGLTIP
jgi:hypothetical protein